MLQKLSYLIGVAGILLIYFNQEIHHSLEIEIHYSWGILLTITGYLVHLWGCGILSKSDTRITYNKSRKTLYDYEPLKYWVKINKRKQTISIKIKETKYAYFATLPTVIRLLIPAKKVEYSFEQINYITFGKRQATLTTKGGGHQVFKNIWEIFAVYKGGEQILAESNDEYFIRRLARHIAKITEKDLVDETAIPTLRYSPEELEQPYFSYILKKDLGVRKGVRERRLDLSIRLLQTKNRVLQISYIFFTVLAYLCYISITNTILTMFEVTDMTHTFMELGRFAVLFILLFIPYLIPFRVSFFVNQHGVTYLEQLPIFCKKFYFPKDDLYDIVVCQIHHSPHQENSKLLLVSERYTFSLKANTEDLLHLKTNLDAAIKAVLYFHFPEEVSLDTIPSPYISVESLPGAAQQSQPKKEEPFIRFSERSSPFPTKQESIQESADEKEREDFTQPKPEITEESKSTPQETEDFSPPEYSSQEEQAAKIEEHEDFSQPEGAAQEAEESSSEELQEDLSPQEDSSSLESGEPAPAEEPALTEELELEEFSPIDEESVEEKPEEAEIPAFLKEKSIAPIPISSEVNVPPTLIDLEDEEETLPPMELEVLEQSESSDELAESAILFDDSASSTELPEQAMILEEVSPAMPAELAPLEEEEETEDTSSAFFQEGLKFLEEKQIIRAMNSFNQAIQENPSSVEAHYQLGLIHCKLFEHSEGIESFSQALSFNPNYIEALEARADAYAETGEKDKSRADYEKVKQLNPERQNEIEQKLSAIG